jgi:hypothetical protein
MKLKFIAPNAGGRTMSWVLLFGVLCGSLSSCQKENVTQSTTGTGVTTFATSVPFGSAASAVPTYKTSTPISRTGVNNLTISGLSITAGSGPAISLKNCINVHITASRFVNGTNVAAVGIWLYNCTNVTIDNCFFNNLASGIFASNSTGVYVTQNQMLNMLGPLPRGQFVQFSNCYGAGNKILSNKFENVWGKSYPEDAINIYQSKGVASGPIQVIGNWIRGGGPSTTGGGINLGDGGGSYEVASDNTLVNPGQYGIAVSAGTNMAITGNKIFAAQKSFTNVGTFAWNQYPSASGCSIITISGNEVNFTASGGYENSSWNGGNCGAISGWSNNSWGSPSVNASILPATIITMH